MSHRTAESSIVITGVGLVTCLGLTPAQTWHAICAGRCGMGPISAIESHLPSESTGGQAVDLPEDFESNLPREARYLRFTILQAAREAGINLTDAALAPRRAIMLGTTLHGMRAGGRFLRTGRFDELRAFLAGHTLELACGGLAIGGLAATTCSACSSSLGSIALAATLLESGQYDLLIAGGYDTISEYVWGGFNSLRLVAQDALRPFARDRGGMKLAEGYGIVVLERQSDARQRGARILARLAGWGESADAHHLTQPHPQGTGAAQAMAQAMKRAGLHPPDIGLIAAHATGTADNDAAERAAMAAVFAEHLRNIPVVGFKSHLGHTLGGAGAVELILSMMAMNHQTIPPCANVSADDIEFPDLSVATGQPRTASIRATLNTSLGFGGANTCVILTRSTDVAEPAAGGQSLQRQPLSSGHSNHPCSWSKHRAGESEPAELGQVLISGIGVVLGGMLGNEAFGRRIECPANLAWQRDWPQISDAELEGLINARRVRRMSQYVKLQLAAATIACRHAAIADIPAFAQDCAAVVGTMHGSAGYSLSYYQQIVREGIAAANPMLFAEAVPNSGAAQLSLMLGLRGACQSIIGTRTSGLDALNLAASRIASGVWDRAIVGAGEEQCPIIEQAYQHCGLAATALPAAAPFAQDHGFCMACGSVAVVLESAQSLRRRGGRALARLSKWAAGRGDRGGLPNTLARCIHQLGQIDAIVSSACGTWIDRAEALAIRRAEFGGVVSSIYGYVPELFSVMPLAGLASVLLSGRMPRLLAPARRMGFSPASSGETRRCFAVLCSDFAGGAAATRIELPG